MKKIYNPILALLVLLCPTAPCAKASSDGNLRTYRVTAHKKGDTRISSQSNEAVVVPPFHIYVPNAITPNGDGINDRFRAEGEGIGAFKLQIFNRWGEIVFETNSPSEGWDGTFRGVLFPNTVYKYIISARGINGGAAQLDGNVTVLQ